MWLGLDVMDYLHRTYLIFQDQYHYIYHAVCEALESSDFFYSAPQFQDNFLTWSEEGVLEHQFEVRESLWS